jgi:anti-anti-sigma factor
MITNDIKIDVASLSHGIQHVTLHGHVDSTSAPSLVRLLRPERTRSVILDLVHVGVLSSAGAVALLTIASDFRDAGGELLLARPTRAVRSVLITLGVQEEIPLVDTIEAATIRLTPKSKRPTRRSGQSSERLRAVLV